ncbi:MAG: hypothetical protein PHT12_05390 [Patescibacteria group bacterium]|nr:hypothetical protein [Patescibacteria group bacterium]
MLGHLIYNFSHLDDVRIQQEISKNLYAPAFGGVHLVHAYDGEARFGYKKYLEDKLIRIKNRGHFQGGVDLMNAGLKYFMAERRRGLKYVLVTAADTWMLDAHFLKSVIDEMQRDGKVLATSSWGRAKAPEKIKGFATDFFVIDLDWNRRAKIFPLDYPGFIRKFADFFYLQYSQPIVEAAVQYKFQKHFATLFKDNDLWRERNRSFRRLDEREPVHDAATGNRQENWPNIGLYTSPEPKAKKAALKRLGLDVGPWAHKLITGKLDKSYNQADDK